MLTIIGLFPATYALNPETGATLDRLPAILRQAEPLVAQFGDDEKGAALDAAHAIETRLEPGEPDRAPRDDGLPGPAQPRSGLEFGLTPQGRQRSSVRDDVYRVISQLKHAEESKAIGADQKKTAQALAKELGQYVEYAPTWVRLLSAICLGIGTMIGYRRIVVTLGERLGNVHLTPAQGASAEVVSAILIGTAGFTGLPVSTTHIVTSGIGGTMVSSGAGLRYGMISRIVVAWALTLPVTILVAGGLYYVLASPRF
jgi:inorganic phosphate transporter, PiT family